MESPNREFYSIGDLKNFVRTNYSGKMMDDALSSIDSFWNYYIGIESQISFFDMKKQATNCLKDLSIETSLNFQNLENNMILTPKRTKKYSQIDKMLESLGVHEKDRVVTLDGHDFACNSVDPIDFVTFDDDCFDGAKSVELLCFNSVKGKYDFYS